MFLYFLYCRCALIDYSSIMDPSIEWFSVEDYRALNKDFSAEQSDAELMQHWRTIGCHQGRLCNKQQLVIDNEFGVELAVYIPYYYYLWCEGLWFNNVVSTSKGMKPFYFFLPDHCISEVARPRCWKSPQNRFVPTSNRCGFQFSMDARWWRPPPYRQFYQENNLLEFTTEKPLLIIHNKHNEEWDRDPINFFNLETLSSLIERLVSKYQIVYIRPCSHRISDPGYSWDHNKDVPYNLDFEWLDAHPEYHVQTLESIQSSSLASCGYNHVKLCLFAKCENYISVQGGGTVLMPFFAKRMLILHKKGNELGSSMYAPGSWFHTHLRGGNDDSMDLRIATRHEDVLLIAESLFLMDSSPKQE